MSVTATNLILGPGTLYTGAFGAVEPLDAAVNAAPAASAWTDVGGTMGGVTLTVNQSFTELEVDQIVDVPGRRLTKRDLQIKTSMAEPTLANFSLALNGGTAASGANWSSYEPSNVTSATQPTYIAALVDGYAPGGFRRRVIVRKVLSIDNVAEDMKKDGQSVYTVIFAAHYVSSAIAPFHVVDQTS
jgi:hypothetical protein